MRHFASPAFWDAYEKLPMAVRELADKNFGLLKTDPRHPSLHFRKVGRFWSVRVGLRYRALARRPALVLDRLAFRLRRFGGVIALPARHHQQVALLSDLPAARLARGQVGTVVETLDDKTVLVEFSGDDGRAYAIAPCPRTDLLVLHYVPEPAI